MWPFVCWNFFAVSWARCRLPRVVQCGAHTERKVVLGCAEQCLIWHWHQYGIAWTRELHLRATRCIRVHYIYIHVYSIQYYFMQRSMGIAVLFLSRSSFENLQLELQLTAGRLIELVAWKKSFKYQVGKYRDTVMRNNGAHAWQWLGLGKTKMQQLWKVLKSIGRR